MIHGADKKLNLDLEKFSGEAQLQHPENQRKAAVYKELTVDTSIGKRNAGAKLSDSFGAINSAKVRRVSKPSFIELGASKADPNQGIQPNEKIVQLQQLKQAHRFKTPLPDQMV